VVGVFCIDGPPWLLVVEYTEVWAGTVSAVVGRVVFRADVVVSSVVFVVV